MQTPRWRESAEKEFSTIEDQGVWEDAEEDEVTNPLNTVPVFKIKLNSHGKPEMYKTRICVQGFSQRGLKLLQLNVKGAFLHSELDEQVFIKTPYGCNRKSKYLRLKKSLYGLKQAPRNWYQISFLSHG